MRPQKCSLVFVFHLRVVLIGISQGGHATVEAALGQAVNFTIRPLHRITEGQRVTVLIHVGRAGGPGVEEKTGT